MPSPLKTCQHYHYERIISIVPNKSMYRRHSIYRMHPQAKWWLRRNPHSRPRRLGARLLPEVPKPSPRLRFGLLQRNQLDRSCVALRCRKEVIPAVFIRNPALPRVFYGFKWKTPGACRGFSFSTLSSLNRHRQIDEAFGAHQFNSVKTTRFFA